jgi:hypothetical protein
MVLGGHFAMVLSTVVWNEFNTVNAKNILLLACTWSIKKFELTIAVENLLTQFTTPSRFQFETEPVSGIQHKPGTANQTGIPSISKKFEIRLLLS